MATRRWAGFLFALVAGRCAAGAFPAAAARAVQAVALAGAASWAAGMMPSLGSAGRLIQSVCGPEYALGSSGLDFPRVYVAHEIPKDRLALPAGTNFPRVTLDQAAADAIGPVPPPAEASALAARLGHSPQQLLTVLRAARPIVGAIAAAPFVIAAAPFLAAGAVVAGFVAGLDPIVFGVIPAGDPAPGNPAAWYILAQWTWPDAPGQPVAT
jgi:hypothetical protein